MRRILIVLVLALPLFVTSYLPVAQADEGMHFHCSNCGSHDHGSAWHDSDKDGTDDR